MPTTVVASRNEFLSNAAIDYSKKLADERNYLAATGKLPQVEVSSRQFQYEVFAAATYIRRNSTASPYDQTKTAQSNPSITTGIIDREFRFGAPYVPADVQANGDENVIQLRRTYESTRVVHLDYEIATAAVFNAATQTAAATGAVWTNNGSSDPIADFRAAAAAIKLGLIPNRVALSLPAKRALLTNTTFRNYVKGSANSGMISDAELSEALAAIMGSPNPVTVYTLNAVYNSATENVANNNTESRAFTNTTAYVWYNGDGEDPFEPAAVKEFFIPEEEGVYVSGDPDNDEARNMKVVTKKLVRKPILTANELMYRITSVIS